MGTIALLGWNSWPAMAQNRDTNPLCYFVDANGNRQDLTPWCGKTPAAPSNAVPSNAPNPSAPNSANPANGSAGKVTLASCRLANDANNAPNSRRRIVHLMGQVRNETGQPVQNVTVRYAIKSQGSLLERRGQMINEPVIAPDGMGVFDRRDQPMSIESVDGADNDWQAEVEAIEWVSNGQPNSYTLPTAQRCF
ncbi:MAG: hypothetical protein EA001_00555 [Oscillatoriales cyanobacterium]|nr:MAG: hypothetical protein EA001_00555 [Oscillatoriales cyanobacterium]